jgi:hypothetical protein
LGSYSQEANDNENESSLPEAASQKIKERSSRQYEDLEQSDETTEY